MKFRALSTALAAIAALSMLSTSVPAADSGWVSLVPGPDLQGWVQRGGTAKYRVENGEVIGTSVPKTPNSFLCTARPYTNFILELEFKVATNLNSGIQIRSECFDQPKEIQAGGKTIKIPAGRVHGYQVEIDPSERAWTGGIYDESRRGWLNDLKTNDAARQAFRQGEWNRFRIEARTGAIKTWINGVPAADLKDSMTPAGFIALQVHGVGDKSEPLEIRWRGIRVQELP